MEILANEKPGLLRTVRIKGTPGRMVSMYKGRNGWSKRGSEPSRFVHMGQGLWAAHYLHRPQVLSKCVCACVFAFGKTIKKLSTDSPMPECIMTLSGPYSVPGSG